MTARTYGPGSPLVFSHIPKTAGNALREALKVVLQPTLFAGGFDTSLFGGYDRIEDINPVQRRTIYLSPDELPAEASFVSGHISPWTTMQRYPGADHVTILRVGQVRLLSQWLHSRSVSEFNIRHWGSAGDAFRVGWRPLREYLEHDQIAPNTDNTITRFLAWPHPVLQKTTYIDERHDDELVEAAIARLDAMAHVNVAENPHFTEELGAWLGLDIPMTRLNERSSVPPRRRPDLEAELSGGTRELLDHRHRLDARVWQHVAAKVLPDQNGPDAVTAIVDKAIERYGQVLQQPHTQPLSRRIVERGYEVSVRLGPRRRRSSAR